LYAFSRWISGFGRNSNSAFTRSRHAATYTQSTPIDSRLRAVFEIPMQQPVQAGRVNRSFAQLWIGHGRRQRA
jgi:hypothetical protein